MGSMRKSYSALGRTCYCSEMMLRHADACRLHWGTSSQLPNRHKVAAASATVSKKPTVTGDQMPCQRSRLLSSTALRQQCLICGAA